MKRFLPLIILSLLSISCSESIANEGTESTTNQPNCSDEIVKQSLKEILVQNAVDTSAIKFTAIRTTNKNEEFRTCECAATIVTTIYSHYDIHVDTLLNEHEEIKQEYNYPITYQAQISDDGESINVEIFDL